MRRVEIARALLHQPRVLVLDEPTVGLDVASKSAIVRHVRALVRERGVAVLWATHLLDEVAPDDAVVVLHRGRVLAAGDVADVVASAGASRHARRVHRVDRRRAGGTGMSGTATPAIDAAASRSVST